VEASQTTLREIFGVGPIVACMLLGYSGDPTRFDTANRNAAYTGTAPIDFSSGGRVTHRLSRRGNRRPNHALHIAAITQIRNSHSPGRAYYERKLTVGKTPREAVRALKRRLSDVAWRHLIADARRSLPADKRPWAGHIRNDSVASVTGSHLNTGSSAKSRPRPCTT
jgi:transposase